MAVLTVIVPVGEPSSLVKFASEFARCHSASRAVAVRFFDPAESPFEVTIPLKVYTTVTPSTSHPELDGASAEDPQSALVSSVIVDEPPERFEHPL